jgi:hypothetical protein
MKKCFGIGVILFLVGLFACTNQCYVPMHSKMGLAFVDSTTLKPKKVSSFSIKGVGVDSVLYSNKEVDVAFMPLKQNAPESQFELSFLKNANDETATSYLLNITYEPYPQLISEECGCAMFYRIQSATCSNETDTLHVEIYNADVINVEEDVHIKIYL